MPAPSRRPIDRRSAGIWKPPRRREFLQREDNAAPFCRFDQIEIVISRDASPRLPSRYSSVGLGKVCGQVSHCRPDM